jgi:hypothetical protein
MKNSNRHNHLVGKKTRKLIGSLREKLSKADKRKFDELISLLIETKIPDTSEADSLLFEALARVKFYQVRLNRILSERDAYLDYALSMIEICFEEDIDKFVTFWLTLQRLSDEYNVPCLNIDECRRQVASVVRERKSETRPVEGSQ